MRAKVILLCSCCLVLGIMMPVPVCRADDRATDRASLRGVKPVVVRVHTFERDWTSELAKRSLYHENTKYGNHEI